MRRWPKVALGDVLSQVNRFESVQPESTYPLLGVRLEGNGAFLRETVAGTETSATRLNRVACGDFIYSRLFAWRGAFGVIGHDLDGTFVSNEFPVFTADPDRVCTSFLRYWFRLPAVWRRVEEDCTGSTPTTRNRYKEQFFLSLQVPLPPLAEQQAIVTRLDTLADKVRQVNERLDAIERDADQLLAVRFRDAIADAPMRPMAEVAPLVRREVAIDPDASYTEVGIRSFFKGTFHRRTMQGADYSWQNLFAIREGDLIFSNIMAWEQAIAIAKPEDDGCVGNHRMLTCEVDVDKAVASFLYYYFTTTEGFAKIDAASPGTAARNKTLKAPDLMAIEVPIPPLATQRTFDALQAKVAALKARHATIRQANEALIPAMLERVFSEAH